MLQWCQSELNFKLIFVKKRNILNILYAVTFLHFKLKSGPNAKTKTLWPIEYKRCTLGLLSGCKIVFTTTSQCSKSKKNLMLIFFNGKQVLPSYTVS